MKKKYVVQVLLLFLVSTTFSIFSIKNALKSVSQDLDPDEVRWTVCGYCGFYNIFIRKNFSSEIWLLGDPHFGMTPWFGKFIIGALNHFISPPWKWNMETFYKDSIDSLNDNFSNRKLPVLDNIKAGRVFVAILGAITGFLISLIILEQSLLLALTFLFFFLGHPLFQYVSQRVFLDAIAYFFTAGSLCAFFFASKAQNICHKMLQNILFVLSGILVGLAVASKMREIVTFLFFIISGAFHLLKNVDLKTDLTMRLKNIKHYFIVPTIGLVIFIIVNPGFYLDFLRTFFLFWNLGEFQRQEVRILSPQDSIFSIWETATVTFETLFYKFSRHSYSFLWEIPLIVTGIIFIIRRIFKSGFYQEQMWNFLFSYFLLSAIANFLWIPQKYPRYFVPFVFAIAFLQCASVALLLDLLRNLFVRSEDDKNLTQNNLLA